MSVAVVLKGYPRLSETFIAQEILSLEQSGLTLELFSLRHPTDTESHPIHTQIKTQPRYLPEYLWHGPKRVFRAWRKIRRLPGYRKARALWLQDLRRDFSPNRIRRFGQALVLAQEMSSAVALVYAHFLHTPASVARYAASMRGLPWAFSAHAKDIWTLPEWEKREKLRDCAWGVTCTEMGFAHLAGLSDEGSAITRVYHGLDERRFPDPGPRPKDSATPSTDVFRILSVGRAVDKKGFDILIDALALLPPEIKWHWRHVGGGERLGALKEQAVHLALDDRISWMGPLAQEDILELYRHSDLFVLPSRITALGDRDGLPNVLMEAASQRLPLIATNLPGIAEFIESGKDGTLVPPEDASSLADAIIHVWRHADERSLRANSAAEKLKRDFSHSRAIQPLITLLKSHH